jgi:peptide/nickel transport system permease protein
MIRRVRKSRAWGKFFRNRGAVAALGVIAVFFLFGAWVLACDSLVMMGRKTGWFDASSSRIIGAFTLDKAESVIGPLSVPGFFERKTSEERVRSCDFYIKEFRKVLRRGSADDKAAALARLRFGERRAADAPGEEMQERLKAAGDLYAELNQSEDLDRDPSLLPKIAELERTVEALFAPLGGFDRAMYSLRMSLGTDRQGRSIMVRGVYSIKVAIQVGLVVALVSVLLGSIVGASAAFFGGWVDNVVVWLFTTLSSIPELVLLAVLVFMFTGSIFDDVTKPYLSLVPVYAAMCMTFWIGSCRVTRGETMKIKELEYVQAATAIGFGRFYILLKHVIPNTLHLMFINFSLLFIAAIKFEVILSFLNLGVKVGPSWGRMIQESTQEVGNGFFWQIGTATVLMFALVLAFNVVSDALQDAFDPKHVG